MQKSAGCADRICSCSEQGCPSSGRWNHIVFPSSAYIWTAWLTCDENWKDGGFSSKFKINTCNIKILCHVHGPFLSHVREEFVGRVQSRFLMDNDGGHRHLLTMHKCVEIRDTGWSDQNERQTMFYSLPWRHQCTCNGQWDWRLQRIKRCSTALMVMFDVYVMPTQTTF